MKIVFTIHVIEKKIPRIKALGWEITKAQIRQIVKKPKWKGVTRFNQETAMSLVDEKHILRVVLERKDGIIEVITIHIARRGRYESTKED